MSLNSNPSTQSNPQLLQQRLNVREHEINALKVQNRHLLGKIDQLEEKTKPNQINTQFVADEVQKYLEPIIAQLQATMTTSFDILQSTMRGIYQQSTRAQQAVEEMTIQSRDLEHRMNEQRKADQNFYQDKIFSTISAYCDRIERQIEIRMKSLSAVELMNTKQNEVLSDIESMKGMLALMQKNSEASRGDVSRIERNASEANEKLIDVQVQTQNAEELMRDTLQQVQNHRSEFKLIRGELRSTLDFVTRLVNQVEANAQAAAQTAHEIAAAPAPAVSFAPSTAAPAAAAPVAAAPITNPYFTVMDTISMPVDENKIINDLIENKQRELAALERNIEEQNQSEPKDDATMILALLRAQKTELQRVADEAKTYLKEYQANASPSFNPANEVNPGLDYNG